MDAFNDLPAVWDIDNSPDSATIVDHDLFQLLQKQYLPLPANPPVPTYPSFMDSVNPQNLSMFSLANMTPSSTSEDSSPSPPITHQEAPQDTFSDDPTLKRKASTDVLESEPNNKSQHTSEFFFVSIPLRCRHIFFQTSTDKRILSGATSGARRKSSGQSVYSLRYFAFFILSYSSIIG